MWLQLLLPLNYPETKHTHREGIAGVVSENCGGPSLLEDGGGEVTDDLR